MSHFCHISLGAGLRPGEKAHCERPALHKTIGTATEAGMNEINSRITLLNARLGKLSFQQSHSLGEWKRRTENQRQ